MTNYTIDEMLSYLTWYFGSKSDNPTDDLMLSLIENEPELISFISMSSRLSVGEQLFRYIMSRETIDLPALSVRFPYAGFIATGNKTIEVRSVRNKYRGPLLICSSKVPHDNYRMSIPYDSHVRYCTDGGHKVDIPNESIELMEMGKAICVVTLHDSTEYLAEHSKAAVLPHFNEEYAWHFKDVYALPKEIRDNTKFTGKLGIYRVTISNPFTHECHT